MSIIHVFNSHRWNQDSDEYNKIKDWLRQDPYYKFKFFSVSKEDYLDGNGINGGSHKLKEGIRNRIKNSNVILAYNNQSISYNSNTIHAYEIKEAMSQNKPIVLIDKRGTNETPSIYSNYKNLYRAKWNLNSIRNAIKEAK